MEIQIAFILVCALVALVGVSKVKADDTDCRAADVVFVLDSSSSIWTPHFKKQLEFVDGVVSNFNIDGSSSKSTQIGVVIYARGAYLMFHLNRHKDMESLRKAIKRIPHIAGRRTETGMAINYMRSKMFIESRGSRENVPHIGIVITDGQSQRVKDTLKAAENARAQGIEMYAIGVGDKVNEKELKGIASDPDATHVFTVNNYDALLQKTHMFAQKACVSTTTPKITPTTTTTQAPPPPTSPTTTQAPPTPTTTTQAPPTTTQSTTPEPSTTTTTEIITTVTAATTKSTPEPTTTETTTVKVTTLPTTAATDKAIQDQTDNSCKGKPADIYFLMDSSASIGELNYETQKQFVKNMVSRFDISQDNTRVGIVTFSNSYNLNVPLGSANTVDSLLDAIDAIPYMYGMTNTAHAIRFIRQHGFNGVNKREGTAQIVIVMTDGLSREPKLTREEAALARDAGMYLFSIGIGNGAEWQELKDIASKPEDKYMFQVSGFLALKTIEDILATRTCDTGPVAKLCGTHDLSDIMFLYDAIGIGSHNAKLVSKFVHKVTQSLDTKTGNVRIGRMLYECLDDTYTALTSPEDIHVWGNAVLPGITELLRKLRVSGFSAENGGRPNAKSVAVLFLDGDVHNLQQVQQHMSIMSNVQFITIVVGGNDVDTSGLSDALTVSSYRELLSFKQSLLGHLCPAIEDNSHNVDKINIILKGERKLG